MQQPSDDLLQAFLADDHAAVAAILEQRPELRQLLDQGVFDWRMPTLAAAKSCAMVDVLLNFGASIEKVAQWWQPGFGVAQVKPEVARYLHAKGAQLSIHAATGMGLTEIVRQLLDESPDRARATGGDGCQPLHFCRAAEIAQLLLDHGAEIDARDEDHHSTPVQWLINDAPDCVRFLLDQGATPDIFMAAGLGDFELTQKLVVEDSTCPSHRIGNNEGPFPGIGFQGRGGSIYQWTLGFNLSPHEVALQRGHHHIYDFLIDHSTPETRLLVACTSANRPLAEQIMQDHPQILGILDHEDLTLLAKFCWETNKNIEAVRLMLDVGFPLDVPESNHGYTALHNAAWCGDPDLVQLLIDRGHPVDVRDPEYQSTAIGWAIHSCIEAKRHPDGRFPEVIQLLLDSGTPFHGDQFPVGHAEIDSLLEKYLESQG